MLSFKTLTLLIIAPAAAGLQVSEGVHNLTICNAYAETKPLSVYTVNNKAKLTEEPLRYKECKAIAMELQEGERIDFKMGGLSVGTFHATHLPFVGSTLVLVPFKRGNNSMAATFASHTFGPASGDKAQVAIIDAYAGDQHGTMMIKPAARQNARMAAAELRPGVSAVTLDENTYEISLTNVAEQRTKVVSFHATGGTNHVVLRVGSEEFSEEILVRPVGSTTLDEEDRRRSGALPVGLGGLAAALAAALLSA